jgi:hypothetical protein
MVKDEPGEAPTTKAKGKMASTVIKRPTKKKPKDKPKRPLSAYNFFFKEEREKILKVVLAEDPEKIDNEKGNEDYLDDDALGRLRKEGGKVSFEEMGKLIGQRWKNINPDRLTRYSELAAEDTERYKKEMQSYNGRQEAKMRSEALKPPAAFPPGMRQDMGGGGKPEQGRGGYPEGMGMNSAFAAAGMAGGYPYGMEFGGYGMGMGGMYNPYAGYPGMGGGGGPPMGGQQQGSPEQMAQLQQQQQQQGMDPNAAQQYARNASMYGMMGGGFQGQMMGYGGPPPGGGQGQQGPPPPGQGQGGQGEGGYPSQQQMEQAQQQQMYQQYGQQGGQGWGGQ